MTDSPTPYTPDPEQKISKNSVMLSQLRKRGTIYVSALALALTAALGTASYELRPDRAFAESQSVTQQKLPSFAPLVNQVKSSVVSIRVKADVGAKVALNGDDQQFGGNENPMEGTPFERFFNGPNSPFKLSHLTRGSIAWRPSYRHGPGIGFLHLA